MFDLDHYLSERRSRVERALNECLPTPEAGCPPELAGAMRHAILVGGKRLRPVLCLASCEAAGGTAEAAMPAALAVELLHGYTLVHDDLPCMDDDALRRGQPTVHVRFGEAVAVLAGDALQALAFELLTGPQSACAGAVGERVRVLARAAGVVGVVGGQVVDIRRNTQPDRETLAFVHRHKTADLFEAALRLGALCVETDRATIDALAAYGHHLGMAFQILDDLLDDPALAPPGQPPELNCLQVMSADEAREQAGTHTQTALERLKALPGPTAPLRTLAQRLLTRKT